MAELKSPLIQSKANCPVSTGKPILTISFWKTALHMLTIYRALMSARGRKRTFSARPRRMSTIGWKADVVSGYRTLMPEAALLSRQPHRRRTWLRQRLPFWALSWASKGVDCEAAGGQHEWYNADGQRSACYHCIVIEDGQRW